MDETLASAPVPPDDNDTAKSDVNVVEKKTSSELVDSHDLTKFAKSNGDVTAPSNDEQEENAIKGVDNSDEVIYTVTINDSLATDKKDGPESLSSNNVNNDDKKSSSEVTADQLVVSTTVTGQEDDLKDDANIERTETHLEVIAIEVSGLQNDVVDVAIEQQQQPQPQPQQQIDEKQQSGQSDEVKDNTPATAIIIELKNEVVDVAEKVSEVFDRNMPLLQDDDGQEKNELFKTEIHLKIESDGTTMPVKNNTTEKVEDMSQARNISDSGIEEQIENLDDTIEEEIGEEEEDNDVSADVVEEEDGDDEEPDDEDDIEEEEEEDVEDQQRCEDMSEINSSPLKSKQQTITTIDIDDDDDDDDDDDIVEIENDKNSIEDENDNEIDDDDDDDDDDENEDDDDENIAEENADEEDIEDDDENGEEEEEDDENEEDIEVKQSSTAGRRGIKRRIVRKSRNIAQKLKYRSINWLNRRMHAMDDSGDVLDPDVATTSARKVSVQDESSSVNIVQTMSPTIADDKGVSKESNVIKIEEIKENATLVAVVEKPEEPTDNVKLNGNHSDDIVMTKDENDDDIQAVDLSQDDNHHHQEQQQENINCNKKISDVAENLCASKEPPKDTIQDCDKKENETKAHNEKNLNDDPKNKIQSMEIDNDLTKVTGEEKEQQQHQELSDIPEGEEEYVEEATNLTVENKSLPHHLDKTTTNKDKSSGGSTGKSRKRSVTTSNHHHTTSTTTEDNNMPPSKKLCAELEANFVAHDKLLTEYIDSTANNSNDEIQRHIDQLVGEIHSLNDMIHTKELEWNNMIHLKKIKEEIITRLTRRRHVQEIESTKIGEAVDYSVFSTTATDSQYSLETNVKKENQKSLLMSGSSNRNSVTMVPVVSSAATSSSSITTINTTQILNNRANMKSADLAKEKANTAKLHRNILPKPVISQTNHHQSLPVKYSSNAASTAASGIPTMSTAPSSAIETAAAAVMAVYQATQNDLMMNGHHHHNQMQMGRQGAIKDVKSIIADYRQRHPEQVPRRGRRMKSLHHYSEGGVSSSRGKDGNRMSELGLLLTGADGNSRPSSTDSSHSNSNVATSVNTNHTSTTTGGGTGASSGLGGTGTGAAASNVSFKDVLVQFAKMSQTERQMISSSSTGAAANMGASGLLAGLTGNPSGNAKPPPPYPEVTLHPVNNTNNNSNNTSNTNQQSLEASSLSNNQTGQSHTNSLLHGILTKNTTRPNTTAGFTSFSPTLARLLTAPERITPHAASNYQSVNQQQQQQHNPAINLSKSHSEITITPVVHNQQPSLQQTLLQQQRQQEQNAAAATALQNRLKQEAMFNMLMMLQDDEADDSVDRLVIDEGGGDSGTDQQSGPIVAGQEFNENEVPECQGCKRREAQFVCAGCGNQWYCSRECQVSAWDEHSEVCTG